MPAEMKLIINFETYVSYGPEKKLVNIELEIEHPFQR